MNSPQSPAPSYNSPQDLESLRTNFITSLQNRLLGGGLVQGPTSLQNTGAQMLEALMGSNFGTGYTTGANKLEEATQTGLPVSLDALKSIEQQRMQQLPEQMAGVKEQLTARGMGGDTDLARILAETAGKAQTDIAATMAPYVYQAGEQSANRMLQAANQSGAYAMLPANAAANAVTYGGAMKDTVDPVAQLMANLLSGSGTWSTPSYGSSLGTQLIGAGSSVLGNLGNVTKGVSDIWSLIKALYSGW